MYYWHWLDCSLMHGCIKLYALENILKVPTETLLETVFLINTDAFELVWEYFSTEIAHAFPLIACALGYDFPMALQFKYFTDAELNSAPFHWYEEVWFFQCADTNPRGWLEHKSEMHNEKRVTENDLKMCIFSWPFSEEKWGFEQRESTRDTVQSLLTSAKKRNGNGPHPTSQ